MASSDDNHDALVRAQVSQNDVEQEVITYTHNRLRDLVGGVTPVGERDPVSSNSNDAPKALWLVSSFHRAWLA